MRIYYRGMYDSEWRSIWSRVEGAMEGLKRNGGKAGKFIHLAAGGDRSIWAKDGGRERKWTNIVLFQTEAVAV